MPTTVPGGNGAGGGRTVGGALERDASGDVEVPEICWADAVASVDVEICGGVGVWWCDGTTTEGADDGGGRGGCSVSV